MSKIFELVRPKSLDDSNYENFEYLIRWIGKDGSDYLYMFYDAELSRQVKNETINQLSETNIESLVVSESNFISLTATDLSKNDLLVIAEMLSNKFVTRLLTSGLTERYAPLANSFKYRLSGLTYELDFDLQMVDYATIK